MSNTINIAAGSSVAFSFPGSGSCEINAPVSCVMTRADMKDIPSSALYPIFLGEPGRYGNFMQHAGTPPVSDVQEGVYIISNTPGFYFERIVEHRLNVLWFGAVGDDTVQCSPALNGAVAISKFLGRIIYTSSGTYRTNACVPIDTGVTIEGDGCQPYKLYPGGTTPSTRGNGTWFHITHTTAPLFDIIRPSGGRCSGVSFKNFGMFQDHPTIAAGWVPTTYPFCIRATAVDDVLCEDLMFHGCYAGIQMTGSLGATGAAGRLRCHRIKGQCFSVGIDIDFSADVSVLDDIHLWPFWSDNNDVRKWTRTNGTAIRSARNDNPKFSNIFAFSYRYGLLFTGNASGVTSRFLANNIGFDDCPRGFYVNSAGAATTGSLTDGYVAAKPAAYADEPGADLFVVEGINTELRLTNLRLSNSQTNSVYINASGCFVYFANGKFDGWNLSLAGHAAISVAAGSTARLYNNLNTAGNGGGSSGGSGSVTYV